ncbi:MAG: hypothetical protein Ta2F_11380 [Termitinemataceae bacterium]|nr:MAG: hypothetical protein Ta2F_11380 [Termitinemataceae bacterium]
MVLLRFSLKGVRRKLAIVACTGLFGVASFAGLSVLAANVYEEPAVNEASASGIVYAAANSNRAGEVMQALALAHPKRLSSALQRGGDWAVQLRGVWYYYADGRLLPEHMRDRAGQYSAQPFYQYYEKLPEWKMPSQEDAQRLAMAASNRQSSTRQNRSQFFYDDLWNIRDYDEAWMQQKTTRFFGKDILVHHAILEELALVEQRINKIAETKSAVKNWKNNLDSITSWNWRSIADIKTRSNHAYGIAVDLQMKNPNKLETYWLWTAEKRADWWNVPYSARLSPPEEVIKAFEAYGFIWGGKWIFYDTMHFEYRPEILILNDIPIEGEY